MNNAEEILLLTLIFCRRRRKKINDHVTRSKPRYIFTRNDQHSDFLWLMQELMLGDHGQSFYFIY